ncbi:MAG: TonB-dependent receptor plug domain-containing protein [Flavobacteriales bacterium]
MRSLPPFYFGRLMYCRLLLLLLLALPASIFSQTATLKGVVRNTDRELAPNVIIRQKDNSANATITGDSGTFSLILPAERLVQITLESFGVQNETKSFYLEVDEVREVEIEFDNKGTLIDVQIVSHGEGGMKNIQARFETQLPQLDQDISRLLLQAPVNFASELSSSYSVRGGSFDENLVYVNGIQVYRPFLVRAGEQEGLSFPNTDMVNNIKFSAGGFQAKYGDKMSSVLDITYRKPEKYSGSAMMGLLGGSLQLEGISKNRKFTHNTGFRYKNLSYVLGSLDTQGEYKPRYFDVQSYLTWRPEPYSAWEHSVLANYSNNRYNFIPTTRQTDAGNINEALRLTVYFEGQEITRFQTWFGAFSSKYQPDDDSQLTFTLSAFNTYETEYYDILGAYRLDELQRDLGSDEFGEVLRNRGVGAFLEHARNQLDASVFQFTHRGFSQVKNKTTTAIRHGVITEVRKEQNLLSWGMDATYETVNDQLKEWTLIDSAGFASPHRPDSLGYTNPGAQPFQGIPMHDVIRATNEVTSQRATAYVQDEHKWKLEDGTAISINLGARANYWAFNNQIVGGPRMLLSYSPVWLGTVERANGKVDTVKKDVILTFAAGYYWQPPFYREMRGFDGRVNPDIRAQRSLHFIGGIDYIFHAWHRPFKVNAEVYYKKMDYLIPYEVENVRLRYFATNNSKGYAYGTDVMLNGEFISGVQSWVRASWLRTEEDLTDDSYYLYLNSEGDTIYNGFTINDVAVDSLLQVPGYVPRPNDQRFAFSMLFQDEMPRKEWYKILLTFYFATGLPYGPPSHERYLDVLRTRSYLRADVGFSRDLILPKEKQKRSNFLNRNFTQGTISLEVFNLLGVNNVINHQWIEDVNGRQYGIPTYLTGRRLNVRVALRW